MRQSAALAALQMLVGLANVGDAVFNDISNKSRLHQATSASAMNKASKEKADRLFKDIGELTVVKRQLEEQMDQLFNAVLVLRTRDTSIDVRYFITAAFRIF